MLATLQRRLLLILTIGLFLTLGVVAYTCRAALGYDRLNDQVQRNHEVKEELSAVLRLVVDAETGQRGYLITDDPVYLEPYQEATSEIDAHLARLDSLTKTSTCSTAEDVRASADRTGGARRFATNHSIRQRRPRPGSWPDCDVRRWQTADGRASPYRSRDGERGRSTASPTGDSCEPRPMGHSARLLGNRSPVHRRVWVGCASDACRREKQRTSSHRSGKAASRRRATFAPSRKQSVNGRGRRQSSVDCWRLRLTPWW